jgi:hypothetical protein
MLSHVLWKLHPSRLIAPAKRRYMQLQSVRTVGLAEIAENRDLRGVIVLRRFGMLNALKDFP